MKKPQSKNIILRVALLLFLLIPIVSYKEFYQHFILYLTGNNILYIITGGWHIVIINIIFFLSFLIPLSYRRKVPWREYGLVSAFFVSLFVEMYGIPFSLLFISKFFHSHVDVPSRFLRFMILGQTISIDILMFYGLILLTLGMTFIILGWLTLYVSIKKYNGLVKNGIYMYSRHPQYLGFILIIVGWFIGWPTILTTLFSIILIFKYVKLCRAEEKELLQEFPEYEHYKLEVPFLI